MWKEGCENSIYTYVFLFYKANLAKTFSKFILTGKKNHCLPPLSPKKMQSFGELYNLVHESAATNTGNKCFGES